MRLLPFHDEANHKHVDVLGPCSPRVGLSTQLQLKPRMLPQSKNCRHADTERRLLTSCPAVQPRFLANEHRFAAIFSCHA